jgi:HPt (histidine-containing phosphotransfer) domain-containing protein
MTDASHPPERAVLEHGALEAIRALQSEAAPDLLARVIRLYLDSAPDLIERMRAGLAAGDHEAVRTAAHTLKSSSANLGAAGLADLCRRLELAARARQVGAGPPQTQAPEPQAPELQAIEREYRAVRKALELAIGEAAA